jgi:superfamily I DNA and/or RNA helicase
MSDKDQQHIDLTLQSLQKDLYDLSARNPLVQIDPAKLWLLSDSSNFSQAEKIYTKAKFFEKEYALKTVLKVEAFLKWQNPKTKLFCTSPLLYKPATITKKTREEISFSIVEEETVFALNPILRKLILENFQIDLPEFVEEPEALYDSIENEFKKTERVFEFDLTESWQLICKNAVGIFNYKKLLLVNDYKQILSNPQKTIGALFGETNASKITADESRFLYSLDPSQKDAVACALESHTVIQGPPGTGKSYTLTNLIKSFLIQNKRVLFVSEKRAALDVVFQKLKKQKLDLNIAYFNSDKDEKKQFYTHLKKNWQDAIQNTSLKNASNPSNPTFHDLLEFYPKNLTQHDEQSGISIFKLEEDLLNCSEKTGLKELKSQPPPYKIWQENSAFLQIFETTVSALFKIKLLQGLQSINLSSSVFSDKNPLLKIQTRLNQAQNHINEIEKICTTYSLDSSLNAITHYAIAASILNMVNKNQMDLLQQEHKKYKAFSNLAKKFQLTQIKLHQAEQLNQKWSKKPTISEITELTDLLKQKKKSKSILSILKRNSAKSLDYFADFSPEISTVTKLQLLEEVRTEWHLRNELDEIKLKLKHELHIQNPETEIDHILQVRTKLQSVNSNAYLQILEHSQSLQLIRDLDKLHGTLNQLSGILSYLGIHSDQDRLEDLRTSCTALSKEIPLLENLETELKSWFKLPYALIDFVRKNRARTDELNSLVLAFYLKEQTRFLPKYKTLSGQALWDDYRKQSQVYNTHESELNSFIQNTAANYLKQMERLAETPTTRLKEDKKKQRTYYKQAKRIIAHELNKKQQHLAVNELMRDCSEVILSLQPLWMMNPLSVSQYLPCIPNFFDVVIFDEASQIPLEDAVPTIYRGAQLIVAGDSQQMPPGNFFSSNPDGTTLLDQAAFNLKNKMLTHHYRSENPALISFSNKHFYDSELLSLPPNNSQLPIEFVKIDGVFEAQKNTEEAKAIALHYKSLLKSGKKDIGIITFSREQQFEIEKQIQLLKLEANESLLISNLENIQGNEKEIILISVAYAKNEAGVFRKNFGPVNQERGANRLNVMFTRAIQKMIVFSSVSAADFGFSDNRGVSILADFIRYVENFKTTHFKVTPQSVAEKIVAEYLTKNKVEFEFYSQDSGISISAFVHHKTNKILLVNPCSENESDLYTTLGALEKRFHDIKIILNCDLISDRKKCEKELTDFFS